ncbi:hypothetical protein BH11ARM2_BH11ARM2_01840 [soil metagenome]
MISSPTTCLETFPFPNPTGTQRAAIADAARELNALRKNWLNPPEWTGEETLTFPATVGGPWHRWIPEADALPPGTVAEARYVRRVPKPSAKAMGRPHPNQALQRTPAWLRHIHKRLDAAVGGGYGYPPESSEPEILAFLLRLNLSEA